MKIRIVSSLADDDEVRVAKGLLKTIAAILDRLQVVYSLKIETTLGEGFQHTHMPAAEDVEKPRGSRLASGRLARMAQHRPEMRESRTVKRTA
ncbi:MAG: hypothetical protein ACE148_01170 [Vicinamibacterales bacterium]